MFDVYVLYFISKSRGNCCVQKNEVFEVFTEHLKNLNIILFI